MLASFDLSYVEAGRRGLKPHLFEALTARLKAPLQSAILNSCGLHSCGLQPQPFKTEWRMGFARIDRAGAGRDNESAW